MPLVQTLKGEDTPLIWATPSAESPLEDVEEGSVCSLPACPHLGNTFIPSLTMEPTSLRFQHLSLLGLRTTGFLEFPLVASHCWIN